jgi:hypothetical protein
VWTTTWKKLAYTRLWALSLICSFIYLVRIWNPMLQYERKNRILMCAKMDLTHIQRVRMLYKTILKLHRGLPTELQVMGNSYARDEFKRHKTCNIAEASVFMVEWAVCNIFWPLLRLCLRLCSILSHDWSGIFFSYFYFWLTHVKLKQTMQT